MKQLVLLIIILALSVLPCAAQFADPPQLEKASVKAKASLGELALIAQQVDPKSLGFDNREQIKWAMPGAPVVDYMIRLDELQKYQPGQPASKLLHATGRLIYPLEVNRNPQSSVVLTFKEQGWVVESFGATSQTKMFAKQRRTVAEKVGRSEKELFQVRVPALQLMFVGVELDGRLSFTPLFEMSLYGLREGQSYPAEQVLEMLLPAARKHNGEPT